MREAGISGVRNPIDRYESFNGRKTQSFELKKILSFYSGEFVKVRANDKNGIEHGWRAVFSSTNMGLKAGIDLVAVGVLNSPNNLSGWFRVDIDGGFFGGMVLRIDAQNIVEFRVFDAPRETPPGGDECGLEIDIHLRHKI